MALTEIPKVLQVLRCLVLPSAWAVLVQEEQISEVEERFPKKMKKTRIPNPL
jgi:hypothetical protein